jgi:hypothetical protein
MSSKAVFGLARDESHAERIVQALQKAGFSYEQVSVLYANKRGVLATPSGTVETATDPFSTTSTSIHTPNVKYSSQSVTSTLSCEKHTKAPEGAIAGALSGGIIGGSLGLLAGIGSLAIPGAGPFIAAGAIMSALAGSGIGGVTGLIVGALIGLGIPEIEAKQIEGKLKEGNVLISVHTDSEVEVERATEIFRAQGAKDICNRAESVARR